MKTFPLLTLAALSALPALAGEPLLTGGAKDFTAAESKPDDRLLFRTTSSYVFKSDFLRDRNTSGDALSNELDFGYRLSLGSGANPQGHWYLRLGARYSRMDFDNSGSLPLPGTLQSFAGVIALEYLHEGEVGFIFETRPGFYFEHDLRLSAFNSPTNLGLAFPLAKNLYGIAGFNVSILRNYPILPALGLIWRPTPQWTVLATAPHPRIIYKASEQLAFWAGGEVTGGAFQVDSNPDPQLNHTVVTYSEFRAGAGLVWSANNCSLEMSGGYAFERKFDYFRAEKGYETDGGAPYLSLEMRCGF